MLPLRYEVVKIPLLRKTYAVSHRHAASRLHLTTAFGAASPQGEAFVTIPPPCLRTVPTPKREKELHTFCVSKRLSETVPFKFMLSLFSRGKGGLFISPINTNLQVCFRKRGLIVRPFFNYIFKTSCRKLTASPPCDKIFIT